MKKIIIAIILLTSVSFSQLKLGIGGGLTNVQSPSFYTDYLGIKSNYHLGLKLKIDLPLIPITPVAFLNYYMLSGDMNTGGKAKQQIISLGGSAEYKLVPGPISPYLVVDVAYNHFNNFTFENSLVIIGSAGANDRIGVGVGFGAILKLPFLFDIDASVRYQFMNMIGKKSGEESLNCLNINGTIYF